MPLEKAHLCSTKDAIKALSKLKPDVNKLPYYVGHKLAALTSFTKIARQLLSQTTNTAMRDVLNVSAKSHAGQHQHGGFDEVATATPGANAIPKAGSGGELDKNWLPVFTGDSGAGGVKGAVVAPSAGDADKGWVLRADGTWGPATVASYYFFTNTDSDLGAYKEMQRAVPSGVEATFARTITSGSGETLLAAFATPLGEPGVTVLSSGIWTFKCYAEVSNASGTTNIILRVYKRTAAGVETQLFYAMSGDIDTTSVTLAEIDKVVTDQTIALTDRIIIKVYALTTSAIEKTVTFYVEGSTNVSCVQTPLVGASISDFSDGVLKIHSSVDSTKILRFSATPIDTATTRVLTPLNKSYVLEETGHASKHKDGGDDEVATATAGANAIPKAGAGGKIDNGWLNTGSGNGIDADTVDAAHASATPTAFYIPIADVSNKLHVLWLPTQAPLYQFSPADKMFAPESGWTENTAAAWLDGTTAPYIKFDGISKTAVQLDIIEIPAGVTNINFRFLGQKDDVADAGTIVWFGFRFKTWPSGAAISAESALQILGNWTVGASNTNCLYKIYTATIASFGLAVNDVVSINLLRDPTNASDDVTCGMNIRKLWIYFS